MNQPALSSLELARLHKELAFEEMNRSTTASRLAQHEAKIQALKHRIAARRTS